MSDIIDVAVIGAGPSGMTACLYALRVGKSVTLFEKEGIGGQAATSPRLENFPSIKSIKGEEFTQNLFEQIESLGVNFEFGEITSLSKENDTFTLVCDGNEFKARSVIIATGVKHRHIGVAREEELIGKGVSYCAVCDGPFFANQDVVVIGDGNTAVQYAILLTNYCKSVTVCTLFDKFFSEQIITKRLLENPKVKVIHNVSLVSFNGDEVESLTFEDTKSKEKITVACKGVFVCVGQIPNNDNFKELTDQEKGFIVVDKDMKTKTPGLYAAGDCTVKTVRQVATAVSDGAIAATMACRYLDN